MSFLEFYGWMCVLALMVNNACGNLNKFFEIEAKPKKTYRELIREHNYSKGECQASVIWFWIGYITVQLLMPLTFPLIILMAFFGYLIRAFEIINEEK